MPNEYRISKISDFLKVPQDRLADCLGEFMSCIMLVHEARDKGVDANMIGFIWTDDGNQGISAVDYCIECSRCHHVVGISEAVLQGCQNLCKACALK